MLKHCNSLSFMIFLCLFIFCSIVMYHIMHSLVRCRHYGAERRLFSLLMQYIVCIALRGAWCMVLGAWCVVCGAFCIVQGAARVAWCSEWCVAQMFVVCGALVHLRVVHS